jgi:sugar/nucleoside kinase (ribokinase family)
VRLVSIGSVLVDAVIELPHLPERGGDVLAGRPATTVGGGFNVVAAAVRQGVDCAWLGRHGRGPYGEMVRDALTAEGIEVVLRPSDTDTGVCFVLLEPDGERTFITAPGVEAQLRASDLAQVEVQAADLVYVSGYDLCYPESGPPIAAWLADLPPTVRVVVDPGPLVAEIPGLVWEAALARCDLLTVNEREAALLSGVPVEADLPATCAALRSLLRDEAVVCVRCGPAGCVLALPGGRLADVPGRAVQVVDSTGAGDCHTGVLVAGLAAGLAPEQAARRANIAAAIAVTRRGPATAPTRAEVDAAAR